MSTAPTASQDADASILGVRSALLARNWWVVALRGAIGILFGIVTLMLPGVTLVTLVYFFAAYLFIDGVLGIAAAVRAARAGERWGMLILEGIVDIVGAAAVMVMPGLAIVFFIYLVAIWSVVSGIFEIVAAFQLRLDHGRWWLVFAGVISIAFGVVLAIAPITGAIVLAVWIGAYAIVFGATLLVLGFRLRSRHQAVAAA